MKKIMKAVVPAALVCAVLCAPDMKVQAKSANVKQAYDKVMAYAETKDASVDMSYSVFKEGFEASAVENANVYAMKTCSMLSGGVELQSSSGEASYENTGDWIPSDYTPVYSRYNLLNTVQPGDIVYQADSGYGISGHVAIVEGTFYDTAKQMSFIRVVEANTFGVARGILDDNRVDDTDAYILRVNGASLAQKTGAINFCIGEIGSSYDLDFKKDTSASETDWYCSELVWAGYKNQGIDIETTGWLNEPGITPRDVYRSSAVTKISFK